MYVEEDGLNGGENGEPCPVCGSFEEGQDAMDCEGCDRRVHAYCAGLDEATEVFYCAECLQNLDNYGVLPRLARDGRPRRTGQTSTRRVHRADNEWVRVWDAVARRLDFDLDFPYDNEDAAESRTEEQRFESLRWQRRLQVASRQGSRNIARLRAVANPHIRQPPTVIANPESQDELRAWNAFDKARNLDQEESSSPSRKRKATVSPASPSEQQPAEQPQLKRPRLQRPRRTADTNPMAESSIAAAQRNGEGPSFLSSLLQEVERNPTAGAAASSPAGSEGVNGQYSPANSPRARSPMSSGQATPRALSVTPPPQGSSPPPLTSCVLPAYAYDATKYYSTNNNNDNGMMDRGRQNHHQQQQSSTRQRADSSSPSRALSMAAKQDIQQIVKAALKPFHQPDKLSIAQYTDVNRSVSRKLYALVSDASMLTDPSEQEKLEATAAKEVAKMVDSITVTNEDGATTAA